VPTTISIDPGIRNRLKSFGTAGMTYNEILSLLMDNTDREAFFAELRRVAANPKAESWVRLDDIE